MHLEYEHLPRLVRQYPLRLLALCRIHRESAWACSFGSVWTAISIILGFGSVLAVRLTDAYIAENVTPGIGGKSIFASCFHAENLGVMLGLTPWRPAPKVRTS